jgi:aldehyde:ferredoxin oxidoreductase
MDEYTIGMSGCYGCSIHCRHRYVLKDGPHAHFGEGPEYTSLGAFGTMVGCNKMETVLVGNHLVNKYGIDTLEVGGIIAWVMELYEKGLLPKKMIEGLKLEWGNEEVVYELIKRISQREGFLGNLLADGFLPSIAKIGKESEYYAMQIKGMSNLHSDERPTPSLALNIATATRGADHLRSRPAIDLYGLPEKLLEEIYGGPVSSDYTSYVGKSRMVWWQELLYAVTDSIGICKFQTVFCAVHAPKFEEFSKLIYLTSGLELSKSHIMDIGERIITTERMFNNREGFARKDDKLPERFFKEPTPDGLSIVKGKKIDRVKFKEMINEYYDLHGWDENGVPNEETIRKLGLEKQQSISMEK